MSDELEQLGHALLTNSVPEAWSRVGYLSLKNLMPWTNELVERHSFMHKWSVGGTPTKFWMNAFFFPQAFLTGALQNFARKGKVAVDRLNFEFKVLEDADPAHVNDLDPGEPGVLVYGLYGFCHVQI